MESNSPEQVEEPTITTATIAGKDLYDRIYQGQPTPQDTRFLPTENGGVFKYFDVHAHDLDKNMNWTGIKVRQYSIVEVDGLTVGLSELENDPYREGNLWLKFISVDPKYQGKGYASRLTEEVFRYAKESGYTVQPSTYTKDGDKKLKRKIEEMSEKYSVKLTDDRI